MVNAELLNKIKNDLLLYNRIIFASVFQNFNLSQNLSDKLNKIFLLYFIPNYFLIHKPLDIIRFNRDYVPQKVKRVILPPTLKDTTHTVIETRLAKSFLYEEIKKFLEVLTKEVSEKDLKLFYFNINKVKLLKFAGKDSIDSYFIIIGCYHIIKNTVEVMDEFDRQVIFHELLHMASSYNRSRKNVLFSGFSQIKGNRSIARGLNEGYTELLAVRFSQQNSQHSYEYEKRIALILDLIVGSEKMKSFYFNANLMGLIKELEKYDTTEHILAFINCLDFYNSYNDTKKLFPNLDEKIENCQTFISKFLLYIYLRKMRLYLDKFAKDNVVISEEEIITKINFILKLLDVYLIREKTVQEFIKHILGYEALLDENFLVVQINKLTKMER